MKLVHTVAELREEVAAAKAQGLTIGLVPTMGALHEGHASLIKAANMENDFVVVSVFVNPTQFGPNEDLDAYPRTLEADCKLAESMGANVVFAPAPKEMYPSEDATWVEVTGEITKVLCGRTRPIHFRGVTTVVTKLFNLVKDLFFNIQLRIMPIVREADGLAKSSRNTYLSEAEHKAALVLSRSLKAAKEQYEAGERDAAKITAAVTASIKEEPMSDIDYVEIYALPELKPVAAPMAGSNLLAVAVKFGTTRLIDNVVLEEK